MSESNLYQVLPLDEKYEASEGNVLIIRRGRKSDKKASASPNVMVEVPALQLPTIEDNPAGLTTAFQNAFDSAQAELIKGLINDNLPINADSVSLASVITFLNKTGGGRVTKDKIGAWFDSSNMGELLAEAALAKNPNVTEELLAKVIAVTKQTLGTLAAPGTDLGEATNAKLLALVSIAEPATAVRNYLSSRLAPKKAEAIDLDDLI